MTTLSEKEVEGITRIINKDLSKYLPSLSTIVEQWGGVMDMKFEAMNKMTKLESFMLTVEHQYVTNETYRIDHSKLIRLQHDFDT